MKTTYNTTRVSRTGELDFDEAKGAMAQLYESSDEGRRFTLRMYVLHSYNDRFRREDPEVPSEDDRVYFRENCLALIAMGQTNDTLRAELYREIGEFDECLALLDSLAPAEEYENEVRMKIRDKAEHHDSMVFRI